MDQQNHFQLAQVVVSVSRKKNSTQTTKQINRQSFFGLSMKEAFTRMEFKDHFSSLSSVCIESAWHGASAVARPTAQVVQPVLPMTRRSHGCRRQVRRHHRVLVQVLNYLPLPDES